MHNKPLANKPAAAFTLVELLTVMAVIALLAGLLLPALGAARARSRAATCMGQVRQIGLAIQNYVAGTQDYLPVCTRLGPEPKYGIPSLPQALAMQLDTAKAFQCPADQGAQAYFPQYGTSYEWNSFLSGCQVDRASWTILGLEITASPLLGDADGFHPRSSRNYLYIDGHVSSSLDILIKNAP
ncbi:MAG: prepilin-type N-terminal cleavage/methylation domain-containing protein [Lentisphaeria bacterium]